MIMVIMVIILIIVFILLMILGWNDKDTINNICDWQIDYKKEDDKMEESLGEALPKEIERVQELIALYESIPGGQFAANMMRQDIRIANRAMIEGDIKTMISIYKDLKTWKDQ